MKPRGSYCLKSLVTTRPMFFLRSSHTWASGLYTKIRIVASWNGTIVCVRAKNEGTCIKNTRCVALWRCLIHQDHNNSRLGCNNTSGPCRACQMENDNVSEEIRPLLHLIIENNTTVRFSTMRFLCNVLLPIHRAYN